MKNLRHERKPLKPKNRFTLCCFCLGTSKSDVELNTPFEGCEAYDYVVEKLAIKRVPINLFATDDDISELTIKNDCSPKVSNNSLELKVTPRDRKTATVFSSYYAMIPKGNTPTTSIPVKQTIKPQPEKLNLNKAEKLNHRRDVPLDVIKKIQEKSNIKEVIISSADPNIVPKEIVKAEVHNEHGDMKKEIRMSPQLKQTINALGTKKRPTGIRNTNHRTVNRILSNALNTEAPEKKSPRGRNNTTITKDMLTTPVRNKLTVSEKDIEKTESVRKIEGNDFAVSKDSLQNMNSSSTEIKKTTAQKPTLNSKNNLLNQDENKSKISMNESYNSLINGIVFEKGSTYGSAQRWKIIIKEHGKEVSSGDGSTESEVEEGR